MGGEGTGKMEKSNDNTEHKENEGTWRKGKKEKNGKGRK